MKRALIVLILISTLSVCSFAHGEDFDTDLHDKAYDYQDWLMLWHSGGLGAVSDILFTDATRTEIYRTWGAGDSTDWTATYLVSQAMRYVITGETQARDEVIRIAEYLHIVHDVTGDPGYLARYVGPDSPPWNVEHSPSTTNYTYDGEGDYVGYYWVGAQSRDKYMHWFWALTWAYLTVNDPDMRATIQADFISVIDTLIANNWKIIDPWGQTHAADEIGPDLRLSFLLQVATVTGDPARWLMLDEEYEASKNLLWLHTIAFFNKYMDYYAFINSQAVMQPIFMLWPDRERLQHIYDIWLVNNRQWQENTHNPFFDAVHYEACMRLGGCDQTMLDFLTTDGMTSLYDMNTAPNYQRAYTCSTMPLDQFSVFADQVLSNFPAIEDLVNIDPQTAEAHTVADRCWASVLWERSPYHVQCDKPDMPEHVTHGMDYLVAYWMGVYYGMFPGNGPYGDDDLTDDDDDMVDDDDDVTDDDDDTVDDDDDTTDDDDDSSDDDDDSDDDTADDDDTVGGNDDDDDDDDGCCG